MGQAWDNGRMSMLNRPANGADLGEMVASSREYEAAQQTVSKLIAGEVPARDIVIVGQGVRTIERVTGRLGYAAAARSGAINGVLIGLLLSAIMLIGTPDAPISLFLGFVFIGVALGMIMSLVTYAIVRRRRDFASVTQMAADHYEVRVQAGSLAKARQVIGAVRPATTQPTVDLSEPPRYGERVAPGSQPAGGAAAGGVQGGGVPGGAPGGADAGEPAAPAGPADAGAADAAVTDAPAADAPGSDAPAAPAADDGDAAPGEASPER